jgi:hypothetical protein
MPERQTASVSLFRKALGSRAAMPSSQEERVGKRPERRSESSARAGQTLGPPSELAGRQCLLPAPLGRRRGAPGAHALNSCSRSATLGALPAAPASRPASRRRLPGRLGAIPSTPGAPPARPAAIAGRLSARAESRCQLASTPSSKRGPLPSKFGTFEADWNAFRKRMAPVPSRPDRHCPFRDEGTQSPTALSRRRPRPRCAAVRAPECSRPYGCAARRPDRRS